MYRLQITQGDQAMVSDTAVAIVDNAAAIRRARAAVRPRFVPPMWMMRLRGGDRANFLRMHWIH